MAIPAWFDLTHYKAQKLAQLTATDPNGGWTAAKLDSTMSAAGFGGADGYFKHFSAYGADEHCSPNATFNAGEYLAAKLVQLKAGTDGSKWATATVADVQAALKAAGLGEWEHYQQYGSNEGVNPSNAFSESAYLTAKLAQLVKTDPTNWTGKTEANVKAAFATAGLSALEHYMLYGKTEGLTATEVPADQKVTVPAGFDPFGTGPSTGTSFTIGTDHLVGTAGNDTFVASANAPYGQGNTWTGGDSVDGGNGEDTIILYNQGDILRGAQSVKNVENLNVYTNAGAYRADVTEFVGLKNVSVTAANQNATLIASATVTNVTTQGVNSLTITGDGIASVNMANAAGAAPAALLITNNTADHALALGAETVGTLNTNGTATANVLTVTDAHAKSIAITSKGLGNNLAFGDNAALVDVTIEGDAKLALAMNGVAGQADKVISIDGSKATGDLRLTGLADATATIKTGAGNDTFTTGDVEGKLTIDTASGNDTVTVATGAVLAAESTISLGDGDDELIMDFADLTKNVVIDGGAGSGDILTFNGAANFTGSTAKYAMVKDHGFEIVGITGTAGTDVLNASAARLGVSHFQMDGADAGLNLQAVADGTIIDVSTADSTSGGTIAMQDANGELNINLSNEDDAAVAGVFALTNVKTVNLTSSHTGDATADHNSIEVGFGADGGKVIVEGDHALTYTVTVNAFGQKVDASKLDADFTFTGANGSDTITGGSGENIITGGNGKDSIDISASAGEHDVINMTGIAGHTDATTLNGDVITGFDTGAGADALFLGANMAVATGHLTTLTQVAKGATTGAVLSATALNAAGVAFTEFAYDEANFDASNFATSFIANFGTAYGTAQSDGHFGYAVVYAKGNAYVLTVEADSTSINDSTDEIQLVATFNGVDVGSFDVDNFQF